MALNVYWDAAVFHALFSEEVGTGIISRVDACKLVQEKAERGEVIIYTSFLTWVECIWLKGEPKLSGKHEAVIQNFFEHKFIRPIMLDRIRAETARSLVWKEGGPHPKDSIHVASALSIPVDVLHTYDNGLLKLSGKIGSPPLKICNPGDGDGLGPPAQADLPIKTVTPLPRRANPPPRPLPE